MEPRDILKRFVLPPLQKATSLENKAISSTRSTFGLGMTIGEKKQRQQELDSDRYCIDFRLPIHLRSEMQERKFQNLLDSWQSHQNWIHNSVQVQCCVSEAVSRVPKELEMREQEQFIEVPTTRNKKNDKKNSHQLLNIRLESLASDPSPLFESMGIEKPFSSASKSFPPSSSSSSSLAKSLLESSSASSSSSSSGSTSLSSARHQLQQFAQPGQRDADSPALAGTAAFDLAPWHLRGTTFAEYRRSMYTVGTNSIFSVGQVSRPIRFVSMNFLSFQADAVLERHFFGHLYDLQIQQQQQQQLQQSNFFNSDANGNASHPTSNHSLFSSLRLTDEDAEEAWQHAMQNSKRALEACSTLLHDRSVVVMSLLKRRKPQNSVDRFMMMTTSSSSSPTGARVNEQSSHFADRDLDIFVRGLRGGFASVSVIPMRRGGGGPTNRIWNRAESERGAAAAAAAAEGKGRNKAANCSLSCFFEPVLVVCSNDGGGSTARGSVSAVRTETLPNNDRARLGDLVGGGNQARLEDHYRIRGQYVNRRNPSDDVFKKIKFRIQKTPNGVKDRPPRNYVRTLVPGKLMSVDSTASKKHAEMWKQRSEQDEKITKIYNEFTGVGDDDEGV